VESLACGEITLRQQESKNLVVFVSDPFEELTDLRVTVDDVIYMPSLDAPEDRPHPFVYFISIVNDGDEPVTIRGRKWVIRQENDEILVVEGDGVVSQTPRLESGGGDFTYNSYHVISHSSIAEGAFFGETDAGRRVFARIPEFELTLPGWA
jgi:ApaG protein